MFLLVCYVLAGLTAGLLLGFGSGFVDHLQSTCTAFASLRQVLHIWLNVGLLWTVGNTKRALFWQTV
jgi:hypothetical protein